VPYFPLELMYIEAGLRERKLESLLADQWAGTLTAEEYQEALAKAKYVVVTTAPTYIFWRAGVCDVDFPKAQIAEIRTSAPNARIIVIGPQGTSLPHSLADAPLDFLVRGEADEVVPELISLLIQNKDISALEGVCCKTEDEFRVSQGSASVHDLNSLPLLNLSSLRNGKYGQVCYEASRGCPYTCTFCFRSGFREHFRVKSRERIEAELRHYADEGYNYIAMIDEIFGMGPSWLEQFCSVISPLKLYWGIQTRTECLSRERLELLISSGCNSIEIGLESADSEVSGAMGKDTDYGHLAANIRAACDLGIKQVRLFCIFGAPFETPESIRKTENFLLQFAQYPAVYADVFAHMPLPGTTVWQTAREQGYRLENWDDVKRLTGVIGNQFQQPQEVENFIAAFDEKWNKLRQKHNLLSHWSGRLRPLRDLVPRKLRKHIRSAIR
jgi:radical SAM superfamily enzyme YgiQ (UPF0313 family)